MLVTLLNWIYIFAASYIVGAFCLPRVARLIDRDSKLEFNWLDNVIAGLVIETVYAQLFSLFTGVGIAANVVLVTACIAFIAVDKKEVFASLAAFKSAGRKNTATVLLTLAGLVLFLLALMYTAESTFHYDTGLYHAQAIHWIEDYGVIKGLGRLHVRLAYNTAYFPLCALFSMRDLTGGQSLHSVSGFLFAMLCVYSVYGWIGAIRLKGMAENGKSTSMVSCFLRMAPIFYFFVCLIEITSPESDYITVNLIIWMFLRLSEVYESEVDGNKLAGYCLIGICAFALVGYKLSAAVMVITVIWPLCILIKKKNLKGILVSGVLAFVMVAPYLIRNVIICGWLVYPVAAIDLFNVPWKFSAETLASDAEEIGQWAKSLNVSEAGGATRFGWIVFWWQEQFLATRMFISSMLMSLPLLIVMLFDRGKRFVRFLAAITVLSLVFYLFKAPLIRYCYGPVLILPLLATGSVLDSAIMLLKRSESSRRTLGIAAIAVSLIVTGVIMYPSFYSLKEVIKFDYEESTGRFSHKDYLIKQVDYPIADVEEVDWYGHTVYLPVEGDQCWYYAFPSSPYYEVFDYNRPATDDLKDGVEKIR